jgi:hypothetical protein
MVSAPVAVLCVLLHGGFALPLVLSPVGMNAVIQQSESTTTPADNLSTVPL